MMRAFIGFLIARMDFVRGMSLDAITSERRFNWVPKPKSRRVNTLKAWQWCPP